MSLSYCTRNVTWYCMFNEIQGFIVLSVLIVAHKSSTAAPTKQTNRSKRILLELSKKKCSITVLHIFLLTFPAQYHTSMSGNKTFLPNFNCTQMCCFFVAEQNNAASGGDRSWPDHMQYQKAFYLMPLDGIEIFFLTWPLGMLSNIWNLYWPILNMIFGCCCCCCYLLRFSWSRYPAEATIIYSHHRLYLNS